MSDSPARLLQMLSLLQTSREWPGSELAARLGVSPRTVRRDIERLRALGYPVQATMGASGGYRLVAGAAMPPLLLDDDEAVAIVLGLRLTAGHAVDGIEEASVRALTKVQQVLPGRLRHRVRALGNATAARFLVDGPKVDPEDLTVMAVAIENQERLCFSYQAGDGTESERRADPYGLVSVGRRWYLVAFDVDRDDWRIFRVDRTGEPRSSGGRGTPRKLPAASPAEYVTDKLLDRAPTYRAVATLHVPIAQVAGRHGDSPGDLESIDDHSCRLHSHPDTLDWLAFHLASLGCEFEVHEPPELVQHLRKLGARVTRATGS